MNINNLRFMEQLYPDSIRPIKQSKTSSTDAPSNNQSSFSDILNHSLHSLEEKQIQSNQASRDLVTGEADNLHQVMIQATEAQLSLELAVQLRNRVLEAMNEIKNMQF